MRNIRKLLLLAVAAMAAMAFASSSASAQTVELEQETGDNCPNSLGLQNHLPANLQCSIDAETAPGTTAELFQHVAGVGEVPFSQCENHFEAAFSRSGAGVVYDQTLVESPACGREPCDEGEASANPHRNLAWTAQLTEGADPNAQEEQLSVQFCLYAHNAAAASEGTSGTQCLVNLHVETVGHSYLVSTPPHDPAGNGGAPCVNLGGVVELEGTWVGGPGDDHPGFEVHHLDPVG